MKTPQSKLIEPKTRVYQGFLPLYNWPYQILIGPSIPRLAEITEVRLPGLQIEKLTDDVGAYALHCEHPKEGADFVILLNAVSDRIDAQELMSIVAHESLHLSWFFCNHLGIELDYENHEAQAYIIQHIFQECKLSMEDYIKRHKLKIKL